jgi:hypothetical protein
VTLIQYLLCSIKILKTFRNEIIYFRSSFKKKISSTRNRIKSRIRDEITKSWTWQRSDAIIHRFCYFSIETNYLKQCVRRVCSSDRSIRLVFDLLTFFYHRLRFSSDARRTHEAHLSHVKRKLLFAGSRTTTASAACVHSDRYIIAYYNIVHSK